MTNAGAGPVELDRGGACLLVTGAPGAGKSTVSRLLAERLTRSARIDAYFVSTLIVGGYVWPLGEPAHEAGRQVELLDRNLCALAGNFIDAGFTPVIDLVIPDASRLNRLVGDLAPRRVLLVVLDPGAAVCRARNEIRAPEEQFFFDGYEQLRSTMRHGFADRGWWFDTAELTPEETTERILAEAAFRAAL